MTLSNDWKVFGLIPGPFPLSGTLQVGMLFLGVSMIKGAQFKAPFHCRSIAEWYGTVSVLVQHTEHHIALDALVTAPEPYNIHCHQCMKDAEWLRGTEECHTNTVLITVSSTLILL